MANMIENMKDHTLYKDAHEKFVKRHVVYMGDHESGNDTMFAYLDPEYTKRVSCQELMNMALDGLVINVGGKSLVFPEYVTINQTNDGIDYCEISGVCYNGGRVDCRSEEYNPDEAGAV